MNPQGDRENRRLKIVGDCAERKRFRYSESASLSDQKSLPQHVPNSHGYRDTAKWVKSADTKKSIMLKSVEYKKF